MFPLWIGYAMRPSFSHLSQRLGQFINLSLDFPPLRSNLRNIIRFNVKNRVHAQLSIATHCNRDALHLRTHTHILPLFILELSTHSSLVEPQRRGDNYPSLRNDVIACRNDFSFPFLFVNIIGLIIWNIEWDHANKRKIVFIWNLSTRKISHLIHFCRQIIIIYSLKILIISLNN